MQRHKPEPQEDNAWAVEIQALKDIREGKTEMELVNGDDFLKELKELEDA